LGSRSEPIVIDSIRDAHDLDRRVIEARPLFVWSIDAPDLAISNRLMEKTKIPSFKDRSTVYPIDQRSAMLRASCDQVLPNAGTLEDLRWRVDNLLFSMVSFRKSENPDWPELKT